MSDLCSRAAMHAQERKLAAIGKGGELPAERSYPIGLVKAVSEESDAKLRYQQVVQGAQIIRLGLLDVWCKFQVSGYPVPRKRSSYFLAQKCVFREKRIPADRRAMK